MTPLSDIEKELKKVLTNSELIQSCSGFKKSFSSNAEVVYIDIATASSSSDSSDKQSSSSSSNTSVLIPIHIITTNWLLDSTTNYQLREMSNYSHPQIVDIQ